MLYYFTMNYLALNEEHTKLELKCKLILNIFGKYNYILLYNIEQFASCLLLNKCFKNGGIDRNDAICYRKSDQ